MSSQFLKTRKTLKEQAERFSSSEGGRPFSLPLVHGLETMPWPGKQQQQQKNISNFKLCTIFSRNRTLRF